MATARPFLSKDARARAFTSIGAGEHESVIVEMLRRFANDRIVLSAELHAQLSAWVAGYRGSTEESERTSLLSRVRVSAPSTDAEAGRQRVGLVSRAGDDITKRGVFRDDAITEVEVLASGDDAAESHAAAAHSKLRFAEETIQRPAGCVNDATMNHRLLEV